MGWVEDKPPAILGHRAAVAEAPVDVGPRRRPEKPQKSRGRLNRAVLAMLGKGLVDCFDEVRKQEVPERFKLLLQQF